MKSKNLFLIFIFGLFLFLLPSLAEAACGINASREYTDNCGLVTDYCSVSPENMCRCPTGSEGSHPVERVGAVGEFKIIKYPNVDAQHCGDRVSCSTSNGKTKNAVFPVGSNGQSCTALDDCYNWGCDNLFIEDGVWDAFQSKCVTCDGKKENRILGYSTKGKCADGDSRYGVCAHCGNKEGDAGDGLCESACGASPECDEKTYGAAVSVSGGECRYCVFYPTGCTIGGTPYADGKCNGKCQYCDISKSTTAWSDVASGYICSGDAIYPVSSTYYCNYDENCDNGDCAATKWWTSCDGSGSCRSASDHTDSYFENVYASNGKVLKNNCSETSPSTSYYCNIYNDCNSGDCIGYKYYRACNGSGSCRTDNTYAYEKTIYASAGYSLTSACGTTGSTLCDSTWRASSGPGDNKYGDGGSDSCQGMCDGSGNCDYAVNCKGAPVFDFSISVSPTSGSVTQGDAINTTVNLDLVSGTSQSVTLSASDLPPGASVGFYSDGTTSNSCSPPCSRRMTIFTTADTPLGNYPNIKVTGTGGGKTHDAFYNLTVTAGGAAINPPSVTTNTATNVTQASATLNGTLNSLGYDPGTCSSCSCIVWFKWGPTTAMANSTPVQTMTSTGSFSANISGLTAGQTYYFEAFAKNGGSW